MQIWFNILGIIRKLNIGNSFIKISRKGQCCLHYIYALCYTDHLCLQSLYFKDLYFSKIGVTLLITLLFKKKKVWKCLFSLCLTRCDADPSALANYVVALVKKDKPEKELKAFCADQLDVFLQKGNYYVPPATYLRFKFKALCKILEIKVWKERNQSSSFNIWIYPFLLIIYHVFWKTSPPPFCFLLCFFPVLSSCNSSAFLGNGSSVACSRV